MKTIVSIIVLSLCFSLNAQKQIEKTINAKDIAIINISGDPFFKIKIETDEVSTISLSAKIEGEYAEHMVVLTEKKNDLLAISGTFQPLFKQDNDKLSAHKVLSVELKLVIPKNLEVTIKSTIASANISGDYANLFIELEQGNCQVENFSGNATINTINGNISVTKS